MWGWLKGAGTLIAGALGVGGQMVSDSQNRAEAERNRQFQERMSNTQVQRAVKDYEAAGLNPALAYDRSASSPGGAQATIGNSVASGISSAMQYRSMQQTLESARLANEKLRQETRLAQTSADYAEAQQRANIQATMAAGEASKMSAELAWQNTLGGRQQLEFSRIAQPHTQRLLEVRKLLAELDLPGAQNEAAYQRFIGPYAKGIGTAREAAGLLGDIINLVPGKRRILRGVETHYEDGRGSTYRRYDYDQ